MGLATLRAKIKAKLDAHTGVGHPLVIVYTSHETQLAGYPCATFDLSESDEDFETTSENMEKLTYEIFIHVLVEQTNTGMSTATDLIDSTLDAIMADFRADYTLGGTVAFCKPVSTISGQYEEAAGLVKFGKMKLECHLFT